MFLRKTRLEREPLTVTMSGVRLGERALQIGAGDVRAMALIATKTGLTGTSAIVVPEEDAERVRRAVSDLGALVDLRVGDGHDLPFDSAAFDAVVIHDTYGLDTHHSDGARRLSECHRVLRQGGRVVVVGRGTPVGLRSVFGGGATVGGKEAADRVVSDLRAVGFGTVRVLADREGLRFVEGLKTA